MVEDVEVRCHRAGVCIAENHRSFLAETEKRRLVIALATFSLLFRPKGQRDRGQLSEFTHRDAVVILSTQHSADSTASRRVIAHRPLAEKLFMDIQIPGTSQIQSFEPFGHEVAGLLMQITDGAWVEKARGRSRKAAEVRWEKGRCGLTSTESLFVLHHDRFLSMKTSASHQRRRKIAAEIEFVFLTVEIIHEKCARRNFARLAETFRFL